MYTEETKQQILSLPLTSRFEEMKYVLENMHTGGGVSLPDYVYISCEAVGGEVRNVIPAAAAHFCIMTSVRLADDMLQDDKKGLHHTLGAGVTANLIAAFQAASFQLLRQLLSGRYKMVADHIASSIIKTAVARQTARNGADNEAAYWRIIECKTPPLISSAMFTGATYGNADVVMARALAALSRPLGKIIQVTNDIYDVFNPVLIPEKFSSRNNLALLHAATTEHKDQQQLIKLLQNIAAHGNLEHVQRIIISSGALSYCVYHLMKAYDESMKHISLLQVAAKVPLRALVGSVSEPAKELLRHMGYDYFFGDAAAEMPVN